jgi:hypothetical protein
MNTAITEHKIGFLSNLYGESDKSSLILRPIDGSGSGGDAGRKHS